MFPMTDFNDHDDDDHDEQPTNRVARKVRAPEYQRKPAATAQPLPRRRRPPPAPAASSSPSGGNGSGAQAEVPPEERKHEERAGYGNPPSHSRFQKGRSGNPKGRPKNSRSLKTHLLRILNEVVEVAEQGRKKKMTKREVIARQVVQQAMKGNLKSLAVITAFDPVEDDLPKQNDPLTEHEEAMLARYLGLTDDDDEGEEK
jgi:hypothetical protein